MEKQEILKKQRFAACQNTNPESVTEKISQILIFVFIKPYKSVLYINNKYVDIKNVVLHMHFFSAPAVLRVEIRK